MKRPLAVTGFTYLSALAAALFMGVDSCVFLAVIFAGGFAVSLLFPTLRKNAVIPAVLLTSAIAVMMLYGYTCAKVTPIEKFKGQTAKITAQLCELPYTQYDRFYYTLELKSINAEEIPQGVKTIVSSKDKINFEPYDTVETTVKFYSDRGSSYENYDISRGIILRGSLDTKTKPKITTNDSKPLYYYALMTRQCLKESVNNLLPQRQAGFVNAVLTGDKTNITYEQKDQFNSAGISHIVAVSGFHISVLSQIMMAFLTFILRKRKRAAALICTVFVFLYMAVVGFSPSVVRAGIMQIIFLLGTACIREANSLNSLAAAAFIMCLINPYSASDVGFLLSFSASLGIILISNKINVFVYERIFPKNDNAGHIKITIRNIFNSFVKGIVSIVSASVSAAVFTLPIVIMYFKQFALYTVLSNFLITFAVSIILICTVIMLIMNFSVIFSFAAVPFAAICSTAANYIFVISSFVSSLPFSVISASQSFVPFWLSLMLALGAVILMLKNRKRVIRYYALVAVLTFIVGAVSDSVLKADSIKFSVLDTGDGLSVIMSQNEKTYVLYCGGNYENYRILNDVLLNMSVKEINLLVLADSGTSTSAFAENIMEDYPITNIEVYDKNRFKSIEPLIGKADNKIMPSSSSNPVNTLYTDDIKLCTYKDKYGSAVLVDSNGGKTLICSDGTDCLMLPKNFLDADFFIVNGSVKNSELICSRYVIISDTEKNLSEYFSYSEKQGRRIYSTGGNGNLALRIYDNGKISIRREQEWLS